MIALVIIPLVWADPDSRKVLVHDESKPSERFLGDDNEGFYSVTQAVRHWEAINLMEMPHYWMTRHCHEIVPCDLPLYNVASLKDGELFGVYVEHFSSPTDADDHFVETPLLSLPDVAEEYFEADEWEAGDWFIVTEYVSDTQDEKRGPGPFQAQSVGADGVFTGDDVLYLYDQIFPCPAPESPADTQSDRTELPLPGSAGGSVTVPLRYDTHDRITPIE